MTNPFLSAYESGDLIVRRKSEAYFWMLTVLTGAIALYVVFLIIGNSPLTGDIRYLSVSLALFAVSFILLRGGKYFWSVNTCLIAILIPLSVIVYFGHTLSELKLYNMALFHVVALVFAMLVSNDTSQLLGLGAISTAVLSVFMFVRLLPQAGDRAANYWASYVTTLLVIMPVTLMGTWIRGLLDNSLKEITFKLEHDGETRLLNKSRLIADLGRPVAEGDSRRLVLYRILNQDEITLNFGSDNGVKALTKLAAMASVQHRGPAYRVNENTVACLSGQSEAVDRDIAAALIERSGYSCSVGDVQIHLNLKAAFIQAGKREGAERTINRGLLGLYQAQKNHTPVFVIEGHQEIELLRNLNLVNRLANAVRDNEYFLHYQPIVNAAGVVCALEALARWTGDEGVSIAPDTFIPLLESSGLMAPFFDGIIETILRDRAAWTETRPGLELYVNLSATMFEQGYDFIALTDRLVARGVDLGTLGFEITESAVLREEETDILGAISALSERGIRFAMDDFGTGYTNFSRFLNFPFNKIKFDKSLIKNLEMDARSKRLLEILIPYFRTQGIQTVCEGVETATQFELLKSFGCEYFQGYYFSKPKPIGEIPGLLQATETLLPPRY